MYRQYIHYIFYSDMELLYLVINMSSKKQRTWQGWMSANEIADLWQVTSRRVRQILESLPIEKSIQVDSDMNARPIYKIKAEYSY